MVQPTDLVVGVINAAGGKVVGKIRLQKLVYLLEQLGLGGGFRFSYHHYGPYSEDLASALDYAQLVDRKVAESPHITASGMNFTTYSSLVPLSETSIGNMSLERARTLAGLMVAETSIVIELAATIHWLKNKEKVADWRTELKRRKNSKATSENVAKAELLLSRIGLAA